MQATSKRCLQVAVLGVLLGGCTMAHYQGEGVDLWYASAMRKAEGAATLGDGAYATFAGDVSEQLPVLVQQAVEAAIAAEKLRVGGGLLP